MARFLFALAVLAAVPSHASSEAEWLRDLDSPTQKRLDALAALELLHRKGDGQHGDALREKLKEWLTASSTTEFRFSAGEVPSKWVQTDIVRWKAVRVGIVLGIPTRFFDDAIRRYFEEVTAKGVEGHELRNGELLHLKAVIPTPRVLAVVAGLVGNRDLDGGRHALEVIVTWKRNGAPVTTMLGEKTWVTGTRTAWQRLVDAADNLEQAYRFRQRRLATDDPKGADALDPYIDYVRGLRLELEGKSQTPARLEVASDLRATLSPVDESVVQALLGANDPAVRRNGLKSALQLHAWSAPTVGAVAVALAEPSLDGIFAAAVRDRLANEVHRLLLGKLRSDPEALSVCVALVAHDIQAAIAGP